MSKRSSDRIRIARVLGIFVMIFFYVHPGLSDADFVTHSIRVFDYFNVMLTQVFSRSCVPLLSIISGFLLALTLEKRPYSTIIKRKCQSLLLPMIAWNLLLVGLFLVFQQLFGGDPPLPHTLIEWLDAIFALTTQPANIQLAFLRDLFVCIAVSPLLVMAVKKSVLVTTALAFALAIINPENLIMLRPMILFFFVLGLAAWHYKVGHDILEKHGSILSLFLLIVGFIKVFMYFSLSVNNIAVSVYMINFTDVTMRITASLWFWWVTGRICQSTAADLRV